MRERNRETALEAESLWIQRQKALAQQAIDAWKVRENGGVLRTPDTVMPGREQMIDAYVDEMCVGRLVFEIAGNQMTLETIQVASSYRGRGATRALVAAAILCAPNGVRFIRSELGEMNARIFGEVEHQTKSMEQALKATPAYRARRALGFGRIIPAFSSPDERVRLCTEFDGYVDEDNDE